MKLFHKFMSVLLIFTVSISKSQHKEPGFKTPALIKGEQPQKAKLITVAMQGVAMQGVMQIPEEFIQKLYKNIQADLDKYFSIERNESFIPTINEEEYKKPTQKDIAHIRETVNAFVESLTLTPASKKILKSIISKAFIYEYSYDVPSLIKDEPTHTKQLDWCHCFPAPQRITFIYNLINEIIQKHPNKNYPLIITSFAAGGLLQEYILVSELYEYYNDITVNIIDLEYPEIPALARSIAEKKKRIKAGKKTESTFLEFLAEQEKQANLIDTFKTEIAKEISLKKQQNISHKLDVNTYTNAYEYITAAQKNPQLKSDVMLMIDPGAWLPAQEKYPSFANTFLFWIPGSPVPAFILFTPKGSSMQLYQMSNYTTQEMEQLKPILIQLIQSNTQNNIFSPRLLNTLLQHQIKFPDLSKLFPELWRLLTQYNKNFHDKFNKIVESEERIQLLKNEKPELYNLLLKEMKKLKLENIEEDINLIYEIDDFVQIIPETNRIALIFNKTIPVLFAYANDAYVAFRDLVMLATKKDPIIYIEQEEEKTTHQHASCPSGTCKTSGQTEEKVYPSVIKKVNKDMIYKKLDTKKRLDTIVYDYAYKRVPLTPVTKPKAAITFMKKKLEKKPKVEKLQNIPQETPEREMPKVEIIFPEEKNIIEQPLQNK